MIFGSIKQYSTHLKELKSCRIFLLTTMESNCKSISEGLTENPQTPEKTLLNNPQAKRIKGE